MKIDGKDIRFESWVSYEYRSESLGDVYFLPITGSISGLISVPTGQEQKVGRFRFTIRYY